jgi:predicted PurR-regulated permease PerM
VADTRRDGRLSLADQIDIVLPSGSRSRWFAQAGLVVWAAIGIALLVGVAFMLLARLTGLLPYLVVAGVVVLVLSPVVKGLERLRIPRQIAATATFAAAAVATPAVAPFIVKAFVHQLTSLLEHKAEALQRGGLVNNLVASHNSALHSVGVSITKWVAEHQSRAPEYLGNMAVALARASVVILLGSLLGYLLLVWRPEVGRFTLLLVPPQRRQTVQDLITEMGRIVSGYVRARFIVSAVVGGLATIGLWAVGMPFWLVLGFWVGLANLIPTLGAYIGGAPVVLVALLTKPPAFVLVPVIVMIGSHMVDGFILSPLVLKETTDLHPVIVLLAVIAGAEVAGLYGVLAAIPVAGIVQFMVRRWIKPLVFGPEPMAPVPISPEPLPQDPYGEVAAESGPPDDPDRTD